MDKNLVSYKALRFTTESNRSSMMYEVKRTRAMWDPSLSVPGTERRGGWRCPVGTRYGGQITDRFGRNCGWGVARRLANEISDLGERLESVGDRRRERKLRKRNERMAGRLAGQAGMLERAAGRVGNAADVTGREGGRRERVGTEAPRPAGRIERAAGRIAEVVDPDKPRQGRSRRADAPEAPAAAPRAPRGRRQVQAEPKPRPAAARRPRRNLRPSEERRMEREINEPGAPRTGEAVPAARPEPRPRPAAPRRPAGAGRRQPAQERRKPTPAPSARQETPQREATPAPSAPRQVTPARSETTVEQARRQVEAARNPVPAGQSDNAARSEEVRAREVNVPDTGLKGTQLEELLGDKFNQADFNRGQEYLEYQRNEGIPNDMAQWRASDAAELEANIQVRDQAVQNQIAAVREHVRLFQQEPTQPNADALLQANIQLQYYRVAQEGMKRRLGELRNPQAAEPAAVAPEPSAAPEIPNPPMPSTPSANGRSERLPAQPMRIAENDNVRARTAAEWRQFFEAQNEQEIPVRVERALLAAQGGNRAGDEDFNNRFNGGGDALLRIRDRDEMVRNYERRLRELDDSVAVKRRAYDNANPERRDDYRVKQRDLIQAMAHRDRFAERRADIDAALAAPAPEPLNPEMARKAEQRVKDAIAKRQRALADHLNRQYGEGNAPWKEMTLQKRQDLLAKVNDRNATQQERNAAKTALESWANAMYNHPEIQGSNGKTYRTVARASLSGSNISVSVSVQVKNPDGRWSEVGTSGRTIYLNENRVYNNSLFINAQGHKNNGIQTIYNQHAFMYAKAAGFEKFGVTAASDGPYVWGRIGFEPDNPMSGTQVGRMGAQLNAFRNGQSSIIKNEEDANIIQYLIEKHADNPASVRHMDFIYALSNPGQTERTRRARDTELRDWFVTNMPMGGGTFWLDKNLIKADPRD